MEDNFSIDEKIDRFLNGTMDGDEKESFLAEMRRNPELAKEIELQHSIIRAVRQGQVNRIMQKQEHQIKKKKRVRILSISIVTLALAASVTGFFYLTYLKNCETLSNRYYLSYQYTPIPSRGDSQLKIIKIDSTSNRDHLSYNYALIPSRGGGLLEMSKDDSTFMVALFEMEQGNMAKAIHHLESLNHPNSQILTVSSQAVKWYLALAFLKDGQKRKTRALLMEISSDPDGEYTQKARSLLTDMR